MNQIQRALWVSLSSLLLSVFPFSSPVHAGGWSWNIGYQNPANASWGLNFLYRSSKWGFELGIGRLDVDSEDTNDNNKDDSTNISLGGDMDLKYFFSGGSVQPFVQGGFLTGLGGHTGDHSGLGAGTGSGFGGLGIMANASSWYVYASYNLASYHADFIQAGIGFNL